MRPILLIIMMFTASATGTLVIADNATTNATLEQGPGVEVQLNASLHQEQGLTHGDVNDDGRVNFADARAIQKLMHVQSYSEDADVNGDGKVNILDIVALARNADYS